ncbi:hypothetical protein B0T26DRAFT_706894 [Lasiosphaeria miniovina]|uniref:Uncharacterized protein n=1 Tax=Lasiosphaeria miniovina TaxID=1954250 RepID=A0AA40AX21_9PEZI|nr:uncharacterized protein B0T26DRAFT_706894 [Lasiosphaeria miniovina]KAK0723583.1 hypothetical protein B0T26DRAFT_706894 [Lasiosphaeria miniovina]
MDPGIDVETLLKEVEEPVSNLSLLSENQQKRATQKRAASEKQQEEGIRAEIALLPPTLTPAVPTQSQKRNKCRRRQKKRQRAALEAGLPLPERGQTFTQKCRESEKQQQARMRDATAAQGAEGEAQPKDEFLETETGMQQELRNQMTAKLQVSNDTIIKQEQVEHFEDEPTANILGKPEPTNQNPDDRLTILQNPADRHTSSHTSPKKRRKPSREKARRGRAAQRHRKAWNKKMTVSNNYLSAILPFRCHLVHFPDDFFLSVLDPCP